MQLLFWGTTISGLHYVACWTEDEGIYSCGHEHANIREAMNCLVPNGGSFIRAHDAGVFRSLDQAEFIDFIEALHTMPWRSPDRA